MILDTIGHSAAYLTIHPLFGQAFDFLVKNDLSTMEPGRIVLVEDKLIASVMDVEGKTGEDASLESHRRYIDIQMVVGGTETMGWSPLERCIHESVAYNSEKDIAFYSDEPSALVRVNPGEFVVFFPADAHAPCIGEGTIRKVVVKVLV